MTIPSFSERVRVALIHAGWTPDRTWDTQLARSAHRARGLVFHAAAEAFLRAYGGLLVEGGRGRRLLTTDALDTLASVPDAAVREYEAWVGEPLAVVGSAEAAGEVLMMSPRGALYGGRGEVVIAYGTNLAEAFERLCLERLAAGFYEVN